MRASSADNVGDPQIEAELASLHGASFGWALACYLTVARYYWAVAPAVVVGLAGPATAWFAARARRGG